MKTVFICHPFRGQGRPGELERNERIFKRICKHYITKTRYLPVATATYFAGFLNDGVARERNLGIRAGHELLKLCDEVHVFDIKGKGISSGMEQDIAFAKKNHKKIVRLKEYPWL